MTLQELRDKVADETHKAWLEALSSTGAIRREYIARHLAYENVGEWIATLEAEIEQSFAHDDARNQIIGALEKYLDGWEG